MSDLAADLDINADMVRQHLLNRVRAFSEDFGVSPSAIGEASIKDSKFLANVQRGENFTVKTYQRVLDWMDAERAHRQVQP